MGFDAGELEARLSVMESRVWPPVACERLFELCVAARGLRLLDPLTFDGPLVCLAARLGARLEGRVPFAPPVELSVVHSSVLPVPEEVVCWFSDEAFVEEMSRFELVRAVWELLRLLEAADVEPAFVSLVSLLAGLDRELGDPVRHRSVFDDLYDAAFAGPPLDDADMVLWVGRCRGRYGDDLDETALVERLRQLARVALMVGEVLSEPPEQDRRTEPVVRLEGLGSGSPAELAPLVAERCWPWAEGSGVLVGCAQRLLEGLVFAKLPLVRVEPEFRWEMLVYRVGDLSPAEVAALGEMPVVGVDVSVAAQFALLDAVRWVLAASGLDGGSGASGAGGYLRR